MLVTQPHKEKNHFKFFYNIRLWLYILRNRYSKDKKKGKFLISSGSLMKTDKKNWYRFEIILWIS